MYTYPASAKAAFRYVRKLDETRRDAELDALRKQFCGYLDPKDVKEEDLRKIIKSIQNIVTQEAIPQALVTKRGH